MVLVAYGLYAVLVVPWIEPPARPGRSELIQTQDEQNARKAQQAKIQELAPLFPPGSPILDDPTSIEGPNIRVLFSKWDRVDKGTRHVVTPCTVVYTPEEPADNRAEQIRRSIVLEAPEGAEFQFTEAIDLLHTRVGMPISGCLRGPVTIRSAGNDPGPDDDLYVVTQKVYLTEDRIWTSDPVEFTWGRSHGRGSILTVKLQHAAGASGPAKIQGIESIELVHLDQLHLERAARPATAAAAAASPLGLGAGNEPLVLDVAFRGPLRFELATREATFRDHVEIQQWHANRAIDKLTCDVMQIDFAYRRKDTAPEGDPTAMATQSASLSDLEPWQIRAQGNPVDIQAPSQEFRGHCNDLAYNLRTGRLALTGTPEAVLSQGLREFHAPALDYQPAKDPSQTRVVAKGPGVVQAIDRAPGRPDRVFLARWANRLKLEPDAEDPQQQPRLSLQGDAQVESPGLGWLRAEQINLWLLFVPAAAGQPPRPRPDRMLATPDVRLDSPQLSGTLERLEVWFKEVDAQQAALQRQKQAEVALFSQIQSGLEHAQLATQLNRSFAAAQQAQRPVLESPPAAAAMPAETPNNHFQVEAQRLRAEVLLRDQKPEPSQLTIEGNVVLRQTVTERPDQAPVRIEGDQIIVSDAMQPFETISILGQRAHVEGQGMGLSGGNIHVKRGQNQLWIEGPGEMNLVMARDLEGRPVAKPTNLVMRWQHDMKFNGQTCVFTGSVVGSTQDTQVQAEQFDVVFQQPINFAQVRSRSQPEWARLIARDEVLFLDQSVDAKGQPTRTKLLVRDLSIDHLSGQILGAGPGSMTSLRRGSNAELMPDVPDARTAPPTAADENQLNYLQVRFAKGLEGNLHERRITFQRAIHAIYGPIPSFDAPPLDPDDPHEPRAGNMRVDADELSVVQMPLPNDPRQGSIELGARGNTTVQGVTKKGATLTARADQLTYVQAKNLLSLVGEGLNYALLFYQTSPGAVPQRHEAQQIKICTKPWHVEVDGPRNTTLQLPPAAPKGR